MQTEKRCSVINSRWSGKAFAHRLLLIACCTLLTAVAFSSARAQDEPPPPPKPLPVAPQAQEVIETIRIDAELVDLNVSVFGSDERRFVGELQQQDFRVFENGMPQETAFFASAATPFDLVLLLDLSGSTADKLDLVRKSARRFVEAARPTDRVGVVTFTNVPQIISPLTSDRAELVKRIKQIKRPEGGTNFWDALRFVLDRMREPEIEGLRRRAVVVMTDGVDNALPEVPGDGSVTGFGKLLQVVRDSDAIVLPIYLDTEAEMVKEHRWFNVENTFNTARRQLSLLALESGSQLYKARRLEDLKGVYEQVIRDLGTVYSLGYSPTNKQRDGSWRAVTVQLVNRPGLVARTKRGYIAK